MKKLNKKNLTAIFTLILSFQACSTDFMKSQEGDWKVFTGQDGVTLAKYRISETIDNSGKSKMLINDYVETQAEIDCQTTLAVMEDIDKHALFRGDKESRLVSRVSENEWIAYYFTDNPWPLPDSDNVVRITRIQEENTTVYQFSADPGAYEDKGVSRMTHYEVSYCFELQDNNQVKITVTGESIPPVDVPRWLVESAFPKAQLDSLENLIEYIKGKQ